MLVRTVSPTINPLPRLLRIPNTAKRHWSSITPSSTGVTIHSSLLTDGTTNTSTTFPYIWLRDSCQSPSSIHPTTKQKLHRTSDIPLDIKPISLSSSGIKLTSEETLEILWSDGHKSSYSRSFLELHSSKKNLRDFHKEIDDEEVVWDNRSIQCTETLFMDYEELKTPRGLLSGIIQLVRYGLLFVRGVPNEKTKDEECDLRILAELFGEIRSTFYGSVWDVVNLKKESKNIAYTNLDLGLHMDLLYFQHPPRYQILHCLRNRVQGGTSIFVDAISVAQTLRKTHPDHFEVLTNSPVSFQYINDGHHLHYSHPTIELSSSSFPSSPSSSEEKRKIKHINYSPPFQAPLPLNTPQEFFPALKIFSELLNDPKNTYKYTLREGGAVLFDNRRVLHARTAFYEKEGGEVEEGGANRWLKGCYLEADAILDRGRILRTKLES